MNRFLTNLLESERGNGTSLDSPSWAARPLSWAYAGGRMLHRGVYRTRIQKRLRLSRPVISVGNLTVGGAGKTPFVIWLVKALMDRGLRPAILSRGYGALPPAKTPRIVSEGKGPVRGAESAGDEPTLLANRCPGVPIVICTSRYEGGRRAREKFDPDVFVLDDGFQHEALAREIDWVLWDVRDEPEKMRQLPAGRLRESLGALRRASAIVLTHAEYLPESNRAKKLAQVLAGLKRAAPAVPVFEAQTEFGELHALGEGSEPDREGSDISSLEGRRVALLSGLARPDGFESMVRACGIDVAEHLVYSDHAAFGPADVKVMQSVVERDGADAILTTEKDAVKLRSLDLGTLPIFYVELEMKMSEPDRWNPYFDEALERIAARAGADSIPGADSIR